MSSKETLPTFLTPSYLFTHNSPSPLSFSFASIVLGIETLPFGRTVPKSRLIGAVFLSLWYVIGRVADAISSKTVPITQLCR